VRTSCLRTAAIAAQLLADDRVEQLALIGAGALVRCHLDLLTRRLPDLRDVRVYDGRRHSATAADRLHVDHSAGCVVADDSCRELRALDPERSCVVAEWGSPALSVAEEYLDSGDIV
jgi:ornithine cyclodeaminase/alanine dehydrogenase-like protein (mu-crystallin family)